MKPSGLLVVVVLEPCVVVFLDQILEPPKNLWETVVSMCVAEAPSKVLGPFLLDPILPARSLSCETEWSAGGSGQYVASGSAECRSACE